MPAGHLPAPPKGRTIVVGAGKAAAAMARAVERLMGRAALGPGRHPLRPCASPCERIEVRRGGASGAGRGRPGRGAAHAGGWSSGLTADDLVLA